MKFVRLNCC